jgi:CPA2 family monovalent cation:H+ antiporter-2
MPFQALATWQALLTSLSGIKSDSLVLLFTTAVIIPLFKSWDISPIIGFILAGTSLGPSGLDAVHDLHLVEMLGEIGIVLFLFEIGLELPPAVLKSMGKEVFWLGGFQLVATSAVLTLIGRHQGLSSPAALTVGSSLALSSSALVLQLLKDKGETGTRHGRASFGILLLQDLAVVPLLIVVKLLARGGNGFGMELMLAVLKACVVGHLMRGVGRLTLDTAFSIAVESHSQEAVIALTLGTAFLCSFITQGLGLGGTLGAFVAGLLLADVKHKHHIEAEVGPLRGLLMGLFFMTVGFNIDLQLVVHEFPTLLALLTLLLSTKASIITIGCRVAGLPFPSAVHTGFLNSQVGELAFLALGIAEKAGMIDTRLSKLLLTTVALSMALTPLLKAAGASLAHRLSPTRR